jgi:outer membrane protein TolC
MDLPQSPAARPRAALCAAIVLLSWGAAACRSPETHRAKADEEVYAIIDELREELVVEGAFTIDPPENSLRNRILAGEVTEAGQPLVVDLVDCLNIAAENSREFQDRREALYLSCLDLTLERWRLSSQVDVAQIEGFLSRNGSQGTVSAGLLSTLGITRLLRTGAQISGDVGLDLVRDVSSGDGWDVISNFSFNLTQPLLRGFGKKIVLEPLTQAERNTFYEARDYERFRRTFAYDVSSQFVRVQEQVRTVENEESNLASLRQLLERNENFAEAGRLSDIQVDQARQDELRAKVRLVNARRDLESRLDDFKLLLGLPPELDLVIGAGGFEEPDLLAAFDLDVEEQAATAVALAERLDHQTVLDRVHDADRQVEVRADALRMGLELSAGIPRTTSAEGRPLDYDDSSKSWDLGLSLDLGIERLPERNAYRESLIDQEAARRAAEESSDRICSQVRDARRRLEASRQSFDIQTGAVTLAERRVESATLSLEAGRADTRDLLEAQESLIEAENAAASAQTDFILAGLAYYRDMELLRVSDSGLEIDTSPLLPPDERDTP